MTAIISAAVIFVVFAVGDMISAKTKAIVSMLLVASVVFPGRVLGRHFPHHPVCRLHAAEYGGPACDHAAGAPGHDHQAP